MAVKIKEERGSKRAGAPRGYLTPSKYAQAQLVRLGNFLKFEHSPSLTVLSLITVRQKFVYLIGQRSIART